MAALLRSELVEQVRVLVGDAFEGNQRFTEPQILRALQWAQERAAMTLGLTYHEVAIPVVNKNVLLPTDTMKVQHVRIGEAFAPSFSVTFVEVIDGDNTSPHAGSFSIPAGEFAFPGRFEIVRDDGHVGVITGTSAMPNGDSNLVLTFAGADPDPFIPAQLDDTGPQQFDLDIISHGTIGRTQDNPLLWDFTFGDNYSNIIVITLEFFSRSN